jgi:DNA-binding NtrC family response regulator
MNGDILIVDDEPDICWALEHILESRKLTCRKALTAQAALDLIKSNHFSLAFLDVTLPDMQGIELARRLKSIAPALSIVIVTGYMPEGDGIPPLPKDDSLFCACIYKPFQNKEILDAVDNCEGDR